MASSEGSGRDGGARVRPGGEAWKEAQRVVRERNDKARQAGKEERQAADRRTAAYVRAEELRGIEHR